MTRSVRRSALPGFAPTLGVTLTWLSLIVLIPLASLALRPWSLGLVGVWHSITEPRALAALRLSFGTASLAAAVNVPLGLLVAWVMVRYRFPGRNMAAEAATAVVHASNPWLRRIPMGAGCDQMTADVEGVVGR